MEFVCRAATGDTYRFFVKGGKIRVRHKTIRTVPVSEFVVKTESGSTYRFYTQGDEFRVIHNNSKEVQIESISAEDNCLHILGYDFDIYGRKNEDGYFFSSTPIKSVNVSVK